MYSTCRVVVHRAGDGQAPRVSSTSSLGDQWSIRTRALLTIPKLSDYAVNSPRRIAVHGAQHADTDQDLTMPDGIRIYPGGVAAGMRRSAPQDIFVGDPLVLE